MCAIYLSGQNNENNICRRRPSNNQSELPNSVKMGLRRCPDVFILFVFVYVNEGGEDEQYEAGYVA